MLRRPAGKARKRRNIWIFRAFEAAGRMHRRIKCEVFLSEPSMGRGVKVKFAASAYTNTRLQERCKQTRRNLKSTVRTIPTNQMFTHTPYSLIPLLPLSNRFELSTLSRKKSKNQLFVIPRTPESSNFNSFWSAFAGETKKLFTNRTLALTFYLKPYIRLPDTVTIEL